MYKHFSGKFNKTIEVIAPGEYLVSGDDIIIGTVLGSCVSVTLYDPRNGRGGLNHFMLPGDKSSGYSLGETGKYGIHAMELLIEEMKKRGSEPGTLEAKIFGGGAVLNISGVSARQVPDSNIAFAYEALEKRYKIPVKAADVGGTCARKIYFFPKTGKVMVKRLTGSILVPVVEEEIELIKELKQDQK